MSTMPMNSMASKMRLPTAVCAMLAASLAVAQVPPVPQAAVSKLAAPALDDLRVQVITWLDQRGAQQADLDAATTIWGSAQTAPEGTDRLELLMQSFALVEPRVRDLIEHCATDDRRGILPNRDWLTENEIAPLVRNHVRLYVARWFAHAGMYDEILDELGSLSPSDVADPAAFLFYQAVAHHRLLHKEQGLAAIEQLLSGVADVPNRYQAVAGLMRQDLSALKEESLDHIARRMDDIRRRLGLGRAGPKVRKLEDDVVASLDKLIEELEKQQQEQQQQQSANSPSAPQTPMKDSTPAGGRGPGKTNKKDIGNSAGWGDLPPKQREQALQQIGKDFPGHYRDVIEQYFRTLADREQER